MPKFSTGGAAMKFYGVPEMKKTLGELAKKMGPKGAGELREELNKILMKPAMVIRDEARDMAPVKTGNLRDSIKAKPGSESEVAGAIVYVDGKTAWYASLVEKGTSRNAANPFFRPAVVAARGTVANMIADDLGKLIEKTTSSLAYHPPKPTS